MIPADEHPTLRDDAELRRRRAWRVGLLLALALLLTPSASRADWFVTPWMGLKFAGATTIVDPEMAVAAKKLTIGASTGFLTRGLLGLELDVGYGPRFFERDNTGGLVTRSSVFTLMGDVLVTFPQSMTGDSLRPYVLGGIGMIRTRIETLANLLDSGSRLVGLNTGAGVIGPLTRRTSARFEVRYFRNLREDLQPAIGFGPASLSFWRATAGLSFRY